MNRKLLTLLDDFEWNVTLDYKEGSSRKDSYDDENGEHHKRFPSNDQLNTVVLTKPLYVNLSNREWNDENEFNPILVLANPEGKEMTFRQFLMFLTKKYNKVFKKEDLYRKTDTSRPKDKLNEYMLDYVYLEGAKFTKYGELPVLELNYGN